MNKDGWLIPRVQDHMAREPTSARNGVYSEEGGKESAMTTHAELREDGELLVAMVRELQANQAVLDRLSDCYGMFRFTGGVVPREPWCLVAMTSYLERPFAGDRISSAAAGRYRQVAEAIMDLGEEVTAGARPRTLGSRHQIADRFGRDSSEIRALGSTLESAMRNLVGETEPSLVISGTDSVESEFSTSGVLAAARGGDP